jgi:hypothetical protein
LRFIQRPVFTSKNKHRSCCYPNLVHSVGKTDSLNFN